MEINEGSSAIAEACPVCGTGEPLEIVYGLPSFELFEASDRGEVALGGCLVEPDNARWECRNRACRSCWGTSPDYDDWDAAGGE